MSALTNGSLYAILFNTGLVKVGRSTRPVQRIAEHRRRLSCAGMTITQSFHEECAGDYIKAEARLIKKCSDESKDRHLSEWFEGINFFDVVDWIKAEALTPSDQKEDVQQEIAKQTSAIDSKDEEWINGLLFGRAKKMATLSIAMMSMHPDQADCVYEALSIADQFIVNDCTLFSDDLFAEGIEIVQQVEALIGHAFDIAKAQYKYWWRGFPCVGAIRDCSSDYMDQRSLLGVA